MRFYHDSKPNWLTNVLSRAQHWKILSNNHFAKWVGGCVLCGRTTAQSRLSPRLCALCTEQLPHHLSNNLSDTNEFHRCAQCAHLLSTPEPYCLECLTEPPAFTHTIAFADYAEQMQHMLLQYKFHNALHLAPVLADAQLVIAPFILDGLYAQDVLTNLEQLPHWFAPDGVLLFAMLGAGALPELVNRDSDWLAHLKHLPNIMDTGARLQALRFGLPVLDVETVRLGYSDAETLWADVLGISPSLRALDEPSQNTWREKTHTEFAQGLHELSLEIIFGQVWQPSTPTTQRDDGVRTVSLESLTHSLKSHRTH